MLDMKFVRENPDAVKENIKKKFQDEKLPLVDEVIALDAQRRANIQEADQLRADRNRLSKQVGMLMGQASNAEKELPDAFLRRCVFHYIEFPEQEQMEAILRVHFGDLEEKLVKQSLAAFYWLRELRGIEKKPSTSELVDWIRALAAGGVDPDRIEQEIPFAGVLLKKDRDLEVLHHHLDN